MPIARRQTGECIFCSFRHLTRPSAPARTSSASYIRRNGTRTFATSSRVQRRKPEPEPEPEPGFRIRRTRVNEPGLDWQSAASAARNQRTLLNGKIKFGSRHRADPSREVEVPSGTRIKRLVLDRLDAMEPRLRESPIFTGMEPLAIDKALGQFRWWIREQMSDSGTGNKTRRGESPVRRSIGTGGSSDNDLLDRIFSALQNRGQAGLEAELQYLLYNHVLGKNFSPADLQNQKALADMSHPTEWFPLARQMHRTIHAHIGPTNSGKTYHALKRLEGAKAGLYAGPLRLLAHEVYTRLNALGKTCALVTGEEQRLPAGWEEAGGKEGAGRIIAATVEMTSLRTNYDVAVIDEIQMLGSLDRGSAWTQALLGLMAKEIHVCGETRALPIIKELAAAAGDKLVVHEYDRLTKLQMDHSSLKGSFKDLRKGDCIVTFSVVNIHALRTEVEKKTGKKAAVVYGSLPPETRAQQARLFNDPDNDYDFLIASDAVGMGLNLSIKRVIFETVHKFDGGKLVTLTVSEIRQIAGRAGRYRTSQQALEAAKEGSHGKALLEGEGQEKPGTGDEVPAEVGTDRPRLDADKPAFVKSSEAERPSVEPVSEASISKGDTTRQDHDLSTRAPFDPNTVGLVTTIDQADFLIVKRALETEPPPLNFAAIQPPAGIIQRFSSYFPPGTPFSYVLLRLTELSNTTRRYRVWHKPDMVLMADLIHSVKGLSTEDRMIFINAPASIREHEKDSPRTRFLIELATCIGSQTSGSLLKLKHLDLEALDEPTTGTKQRLRQLEELHKSLVLYLWLSFRFPGVFVERPLGNHVKELVEREIEETLRLMTFVEGEKRRSIMRKVAKTGVETELERLVRESRERMGLDEYGNPRTTGEGEVAAAEHEEMGGEALEERLPQDDEGAYPEEDEGRNVDVAVVDDPVDAGKAENPDSTSTFSAWRLRATQLLTGDGSGKEEQKPSDPTVASDVDGQRHERKSAHG